MKAGPTLDLISLMHGIVIIIMVIILILIMRILIIRVPVGFWSGGADRRREIELGLWRKRFPMAVGPMPSFACHMRARRFSSADILGGCGGSLDCFWGILGRTLDGEHAAEEWIGKFAQDFPDIS